MRHCRLLLVQAATLCLLATAAVAEPHAFSPVECARCHLPEGAGAGPLLTADIDPLCADCHHLAEANGHPSPARPSMDVPEGLWLDGEGRVNCATCHDPHPAEGAAPPYLRGGATGRTFCALCHAGDAPHRGAAFLAHSKAYTPSTGGGLDRVSRDCLECHDPAAPHASVCIIGRQGQCSGHVVGLDYEAATVGNPGFTPRADLPPRVSLYEGKIGCASCHSIYSDKAKLLVMDNRGSALCLACHRK